RDGDAGDGVGTGSGDGRLLHEGRLGEDVALRIAGDVVPEGVAVGVGEGALGGRLEAADLGGVDGADAVDQVRLVGGGVLAGEELPGDADDRRVEDEAGVAHRARVIERIEVRVDGV